MHINNHNNNAYAPRVVRFQIKKKIAKKPARANRAAPIVTYRLHEKGFEDAHELLLNIILTHAQPLCKSSTRFPIGTACQDWRVYFYFPRERERESKHALPVTHALAGYTKERDIERANRIFAIATFRKV